MQIHHLNCGTMRPRGQRPINGYGSWRADALMVAHCLLVEADDGLILVDTGFGLLDIAAPRRRLGWLFLANVRPVLDPAETAAKQVEALGFERRDVRHIVLTHLDADHAGGLSDFADAQVHLYLPEHRSALQAPTKSEHYRYRSIQWAHEPRWQPHELGGERLWDLPAVQVLEEPEIWLVPTVGHSRGHALVAVRGPERWVVHGGDAYFSRFELGDPPRSPVAMGFFQWLVAFDRRAAPEQQRRLRQLLRDHGDELTLFSSHDPDELAELADR